MPAILTDPATCTCELCGGFAVRATFEDLGNDWTPVQIEAAMCLDCGHETEHEIA